MWWLYVHTVGLALTLEAKACFVLWDCSWNICICLRLQAGVSCCTNNINFSHKSKWYLQTFFMDLGLSSFILWLKCFPLNLSSLWLVDILFHVSKLQSQWFFGMEALVFQLLQTQLFCLYRCWRVILISWLWMVSLTLFYQTLFSEHSLQVCLLGVQNNLVKFSAAQFSGPSTEQRMEWSRCV